MTIWLMNHYATSMYRDRAGRHYWFAKELIKRGHDVVVFCANTFMNTRDVIDIERGKWIVKCVDDIPFVFVKTATYSGNGLDRVANMSLFYLNLRTSAMAYGKQYGKPDVIVASSVHPMTMVAGIQIARRMKIPCICEVRDLWPEMIFYVGKVKEKSFLGRVLIAGEHWIYKKADALIYTKEGDVDYLKEKGWTSDQGGDIPLEKCNYINNGVDLSVYDKRLYEEVYPDVDLDDPEKFNVVYAGAIRMVNNVGNLLDCAAILKKDGCDGIQMLIFGDGNDFMTLKKRAADEHLDNVKLKGFVDRKFIPNILSKSDANLLHYSQHLGNWIRGVSSNKLFEYMASGKPVISTVKPSYSIVEKYHCGTEIGSDDPKRLAAVIEQYYKMPLDEREQIGRNARDGAKDFDYTVLTDKLMRVIESILE